MKAPTTLDMRCTVCDRPLAIPVQIDTERVNGEWALTMTIDEMYIRAHCLTHGYYDGTPIEAAA